MNELIRQAVRYFWEHRNSGLGVRGGKTLDGFIHVIGQAVQFSNLNGYQIHTDTNSSQLPGYFRPHKSWDIVITWNGQLVAAVELKSQVGSIGNNFNNRTEEVLGSGLDLTTAIEENAFTQEMRPFMGYLILVEDSDTTRSCPRINMKHFPVMPGFLADETSRHINYLPSGGIYPRADGVSYLQRYDILCHKLMAKRIYDSASVIVASEFDAATGTYRDLSGATSVDAFLDRLIYHCNHFARYAI